MTIFQRIKHNPFFSFFIVACTLLLTFSSCKKDLTSLIGGGLQPDDEWIYAVFNNTDESLRLITYTVADQPGQTNRRDFYALGSFYDETFGVIKVDLISQLYELSTWDTVKEFYEIDSVVLTLIYHSIYPFEENVSMNSFVISIGELLNPVTIDSASLFNVYKSDDFLPQKAGGGTILSNWRVSPNLRDSISIPDPNDSAAEIKEHVPTLRIPLYADDNKNIKGKDFAERLLSVSMQNLELNDFLREITGLYIEAHPETQPNYGSVVNFDFTRSFGTPGIKVYYKKTPDDTASSVKEYELDFFGAMTYNYVEIDRATQSPNLANQINQTDTALGLDMVFLQSFFGSLVRVERPDIRDFAKLAGDNHRMIINQASLVLNTSPNGLNGRFTPVPSMNIFRQIDTDSIASLPDHFIELAGGYNSSKQEYRIILTRYIQSLLLDPTIDNVPLTIFSNNRFLLPDITSIYGPNAEGDKRMRLEIVYSLLPKN